MIKLRRRAKQNRTFDPASLPFVDEQLTAKGRVECLFSLNFNLNFYPNSLPLCYSELDFAVITGVSEVIQNKSRANHTALDSVLQEHAILPLSKGEDRMLNERKRINSILGEGSSCRVASAMLNLFQYLTNMKEELLAKKIFTPQHLASLACNLFTNKILNQVQDDITKNPRKNFPFFNTSEKGWYKKCLA